MENIHPSFYELCQRARGRELVLYGMGMSATEAVWLLSSCGIDIQFFVDRKASITPSFLGKRVEEPACLSAERHYVVIVPAQYTGQISQILIRKGFEAGTDFCTWDSLRDRKIVVDGVLIGRHTHGFSAFSDCLGHSTKNYVASIGSFVSINKTAMIGGDHKSTLTSSHEVFRIAGIENTPVKKAGAQGVTIGNDVWIGAHVFINASKVKSIGNGAVIGSGSIVIEDVPPYAVVAGVPAKVKKFRFTPDQIALIEKIKWWEWSEDEIKENADCFADADTFFARYGSLE